MSTSPMNGGANLKLWQVIVSQIPWAVTLLSLGGWQAAKFDSRLATLERAILRIESRQEQAQAEKLEEMRQEVERMRRVVPDRR